MTYTRQRFLLPSFPFLPASHPYGLLLVFAVADLGLNSSLLFVVVFFWRDFSAFFARRLFFPPGGLSSPFSLTSDDTRSSSPPFAADAIEPRASFLTLPNQTSIFPPSRAAFDCKLQFYTPVPSALTFVQLRFSQDFCILADCDRFSKTIPFPPNSTLEHNTILRAADRVTLPPFLSFLSPP